MRGVCHRSCSFWVTWLYISPPFLGSLWFPCPSSPVMLRVEVLLSLTALVFLFNLVREFSSLDC